MAESGSRVGSNYLGYGIEIGACVHDWGRLEMITWPHRDSNDEADSRLRDMCGRASGDRGDGDAEEVGLSTATFSGNWNDGEVAAGEVRREMYGGGRGFGASSWTGVLALEAGASSASERSSRIARGGGRSTWASSNFGRRS